MPNRILREGINGSARVNRLSMGAEVLYRRLMSVADDYGRFYASAATVRGACWPTAPEKVREEDVAAWLVECGEGDRPLLRFYAADGCRYLEIADFKQQTRAKSKFPEPANNLLSICEQNARSSRSRISETESIENLRAAAAAPAPAAVPPVGNQDDPAFSKAVETPQELVLMPDDPERTHGKAWFDRGHERWYRSYWKRVGKKNSRVQYELRIKALVRSGKSHEDAAQFLFEQAAADRARFEPTPDWEWRQNLHPERWLKHERWTDEPSNSKTKLRDPPPSREQRRQAEIDRSWQEVLNGTRER